MEFREIKFRSGLYWLLVSMLFIFLFYACGSGQGSSSDSTGTGSLGFKLIWQNRSDLRAAQQTDRSDVCADYLIATITADVYNASNAVVASQSW
ncbi:MAG: hypothetical protein PVH22_09130, partial [Desulfobacteraceae bacterium]